MRLHVRRFPVRLRFHSSARMHAAHAVLDFLPRLWDSSGMNTVFDIRSSFHRVCPIAGV